MKDTVKGCFECTNWDTFLTAQILLMKLLMLFRSISISAKSIKSYPNNKPWITKDIRSKIHEKNRIKSSTDSSALKKCQEELDNAICKSKSKLEGYFKANRNKFC